MSFNFMKDTTEQAKQKLLSSNWEQEQDADQLELAELNRIEFEQEQQQLMRDELRRDEQEEHDPMKDAGMSLRDFL